MRGSSDEKVGRTKVARLLCGGSIAARQPTCRHVLPSQLMPIDQILSMLIAERDKLNRAIAALKGSPQRSTSRRKAAATTGTTAST